MGAAIQKDIPSAESSALDQLAAVILLGGSVRATDFSQRIGRSVLDLPIEAGQSLLDYWHQQTIRLANAAGLRRLQVRVMMDRDSLEPSTPRAHEHAVLSIERDLFEYRGTGGVLKDLSGGYADDDFLLIANAAQIFIEELSEIASLLATQAGDVTLISHRDGTPSGLMLVRCAALRGIASAGFVDMKEQALPQIAINWRVKVLHRQLPTGFAIRTLSDYIMALRRFHHHRQGTAASTDPYAEDWQPAFRVIEPGADVAKGARVHDSVVLKGAVVESGAAVVRSVVCPGAVVHKGTAAVEKLISPERP